MAAISLTAPKQKYRDDVLAAVSALLAERPEATPRKMFGHPGFAVGGKMFACLYDDGVAVKLRWRSRRRCFAGGHRVRRPRWRARRRQAGAVVAARRPPARERAPGRGLATVRAMNRTDRLMGILLELQARGELRAEDLAGTFEVSVRTIYRDVEALCETGVPVVATPGKGYRLMEGYFLPPLSFTADEAALLLLGGELVRDRVDPLLRTAAEVALRKLASVLPPDRRAEMERRRQGLFFASLARQADDRRLVLARRAIEERRVVRLLYHAFRREQADPRDVEPIRLVHFGDSWYLAGYCRLRQDTQLFRLDRIDRLEVLEERYTPERPPRRFPTASSVDLADVSGGACPLRSRGLALGPRAPAVMLLREEQDAEGPIFVYALRDEQEILTWLLPWGRAVEVLSPAWLRVRIAEEALAIAARHTTAAAMPCAAPIPAT